MKKVLLVLAIGLAMMSCTKDEVSTNCNEEVIEFDTRTLDNELIYIVKVDDNGIIRRYQVSEEVWYNLKAEELENGFACLTTLN